MADWPYNTQRWQRLRRLKLRANLLCEDCLPKLTPATDVDHIKAIQDGGEVWDIENLRELCHACHSRKTRYREQLRKDRVPMKGCDAEGRPLDKKHWWNAGPASHEC